MSTRKTLSATAKKNGEQADNARSSSPTARVSHDEEIQLARIIQRGVEVHNLKSKFEEKHGRDISRQEWTEIAKLKSPKELRRIVSTYRKAKNKLVMANMGLVHAVVRSKLGMVGASRSASKTTTGGISYEELIQEGSLGLLRAAELFDPSRCQRPSSRPRSRSSSRSRRHSCHRRCRRSSSRFRRHSCCRCRRRSSSKAPFV